jgi:hypothetical protein
MATFALPKEASFRSRHRAFKRTALKIEATADPFEVLVTVPPCPVCEGPTPMHRVVAAESRGNKGCVCSPECKVVWDRRNRPSKAKVATRKPAAKPAVKPASKSVMKVPTKAAGTPKKAASRSKKRSR